MFRILLWQQTNNFLFLEQVSLRLSRFAEISFGCGFAACAICVLCASVVNYGHCSPQRAENAERHREEPFRRKKVDNDWVDTSVLSRFAEPLTTRATKKRFTYIDLQGQDCLIGCAPPELRAALESATKMKVEWLT